jgi:hypothetical protein
MNDDRRIDDRSAARAHRGSPPILVVMKAGVASRRSPKRWLQGSEGRSKTAKCSIPKWISPRCMLEFHWFDALPLP